MELVLKTPASKDPITLEEVKILVGLESDQSQFDALLQSFMKASIELFEFETNTVLMEQIWYGYLEDWPFEVDYIEIWKPPLQSITAIKYTTSAGDINTWAATEYVVDAKTKPGRVYLGYNKNYPTATLEYSGKAIEIEFKCGYSKAGDVPFNIRNVLKLIVEYWFTNRGAEAGKIPDSLLRLIHKHKVFYL